MSVELQERQLKNLASITYDVVEPQDSDLPETGTTSFIGNGSDSDVSTETNSSLFTQRRLLLEQGKSTKIIDDKIVLANMGLVYQRAVGYAMKSGQPIDDYLQEGIIGLLEAVAKFDHEKGAFSTKAYWEIWSAVGQYANKNRNPSIVMPPAYFEYLNKVSKAQAEIRENKEDPFNLELLAQKTGLSKEIVQGIILLAGGTLSFQMPLFYDGDEETLESFVPNKHNVEETAIRNVTMEEIEEELERLLGNSRRLQVAKHKLGVDAPLCDTYEEIAILVGCCRETARLEWLSALRILQQSSNLRSLLYSLVEN